MMQTKELYEREAVSSRVVDIHAEVPWSGVKPEIHKDEVDYTRMEPCSESLTSADGLGISTTRIRRVRRWYNCWEIFSWRVKHLVRYQWRDIPAELLIFSCWLLSRVIRNFPRPTVGRTYLQKIAGNGDLLIFGYVGCELVVTAGKNYVAACFDGTSTITNLKYHGFGTGITAAAAGDTALQTEFTTQYATDNTRPTGSQAHSTNTYTTIATFSPDTGGTLAVTEWGLLSQAATGGGTLLDHQVFSAVNLVSGSDSLQSTYVLTLS